MWRLPSRTHNSLLPLVNNSLPLFDELCRRSVNFVQTCIFHNSHIVRFVSRHGLFYSARSSFICHNIHLCINRFQLSSIFDVLYRPVYHFINKHSLNNTLDPALIQTAEFILDLIDLRDDPAWAQERCDLTEILDFLCLS